MNAGFKILLDWPIQQRDYFKSGKRTNDFDAGGTLEKIFLFIILVDKGLFMLYIIDYKGLNDNVSGCSSMAEH